VHLRVLLLVSVALTRPLTRPLAAQTTVIDAGAFTLSVNGERVGHEQFSIKRNTVPTGSTLLATATITLAGRRLTSTLRTDTIGHPLGFSLIEYAGAQAENRVSADVVGPGRLSLRVTNAAGQADREIRMAAGMVISDAEMVHQYYFYARSSAQGRVPVLIPRRLALDSVTVTVAGGTQEVAVGNVNMPARHLIVTDGAGVVTDLWLDAAGRLLRVAVQSRGFVAARDDPPA
jgi:hypothetical protein